MTKEQMIRINGECYGDPAWSGAQAAQITGVPIRTTQHWGQTGFFRPSIAVVKDGLGPDDEGLVYSFPHLLGIELPRGGVSWFYGLGDCVGLRVAHDLRQRKVPMEVVQGPARTLADFDADFLRGRYRQDPHFRWLTYIPDWMWEEADKEPPSPEEALTFSGEEPPEPPSGEGFDGYVVYDAYTAICGVVERADDWLRREGVDPDTRPYWL